MTKQFLIFLFVLTSLGVFGQTKKNETGNYIYISNTEIVMQGVKTELKLNSKTKRFSVTTSISGDIRPAKEKLEGDYVLFGDTIIFSFKYSQIVINPMFNCKEPEDKFCLCSDTLIYKIGSVSTKDKEIVLKKSK